MDEIVTFLALVERVGAAEAASQCVERLNDKSFDTRMSTALLIASYLGHELKDDGPDDSVTPETPLDETCLICHRRLFVPVDRGGIEGTMLDAECTAVAGSTDGDVGLDRRA